MFYSAFKVFRCKRLVALVHPFLKQNPSLKHYGQWSIINKPSFPAITQKKYIISCACASYRQFSEKVKPNFKENDLDSKHEKFKLEIASSPANHQKPPASNANQFFSEVKKIEPQSEKDDGDDSNDEFESALLDYYFKKAKDDLDYMDDVDYHDIQDSNHRVFFKIVDLWLKEVGPAKRGHRDFITALLNSLHKFNIENEVSAYLRLLDCFPQGKHTGINRVHWFKAAFQDRLGDHALGVQIFRKVFNNAVPNDQIFNKATDLFGRYSPATRAARSIMFWYPKMTAADPFPVTKSELKQLTPIEIAFKGLRQMNPGLDSHYHNFLVDKSRCSETLKAGQIDSVISVQTDVQIAQLAKHDPDTPVYVEGPYLTYFKTKSIRYFVMRSDPKRVKPTAPTQILTTKEWWSKFYNTEWTTGQKPVSRGGEDFFPIVDIVDCEIKKTNEIAVVESDTKDLEGTVYAIACTDYKSPEALLTWIRGLVPQNPILSKCSVMMREDDAFLLNAPKTDPNESYYEDIELPDIH